MAKLMRGGGRKHHDGGRKTHGKHNNGRSGDRQRQPGGGHSHGSGQQHGRRRDGGDQAMKRKSNLDKFAMRKQERIKKMKMKSGVSDGDGESSAMQVDALGDMIIASETTQQQAIVKPPKVNGEKARLVDADIPQHEYFNAMHVRAAEQMKLSKLEIGEHATKDCFVDIPKQKPNAGGDAASQRADVKATLTFMKSHLNRTAKSGASSIPSIVIVTFSAVRACEILKLIAPLRCPVGKVFGKGDINEQREFLQARKPSIVIGTPGRMLRMHSEGGMKFVGDDRVMIVDSKRNEKSFNVLDMPGVNVDFFNLYSRAGIQQAVVDGKVKLMMGF